MGNVDLLLNAPPPVDDLGHIAPDLRPLARPVAGMHVDPANARIDHNLEVIAQSLNYYGQRTPIVVNIDEGGKVEKGNGTFMAATMILGWEWIAAVLVRDDPTTAAGYAIMDNRAGDLSRFDIEATIRFLEAIPPEVPTGFTADEARELMEEMSRLQGGGDPPGYDPDARKTLAEQFIIPPFSVMDGRKGYWQERKRTWVGLGFKSDLGGREALSATGSLSGSVPGYYYKKDLAERELGRKLSNTEFEEHYLADYIPENTLIASTSTGGILSLFDPVVAELSYVWFTAEGYSVLDPFAGGAVRGIVAHMMKRKYTGIDLRPEQVQANIDQAGDIFPENPPTWISGDSLEMESLLPPGEMYDFIFSCPPYFDLEIYSDDEKDISNMEWDQFLITYRKIISLAAARLRDNRFSCFVVQDIRDRGGMFRNFVGETIEAFQDAGMHLYNDAVLVTPVGSLAIRVPRQFSSMRKLGKSHQNILYFVKGDPKIATQAVGQIDTDLLDELVREQIEDDSDEAPETAASPPSYYSPPAPSPQPNGEAKKKR